MGATEANSIELTDLPLPETAALPQAPGRQYLLLLFTVTNCPCFKWECGDVVSWFTETSTGGHRAATGGEGSDHMGKAEWQGQLYSLALHSDGSRLPLYGANSKNFGLQLLSSAPTMQMSIA